MRPLWALRYLLRFGLSTAVLIRRFAPAALVARRLSLTHPPFLGHWIVREDFALENPNLDATHAVSRLSGAVGEIDIGSQRMQRYAAFAIPFHAGDLGSAQPTGTIDPDPLCAEPHRRLHCAFHRPAKGDAPLQLLRNAVSDQLGLDLGLSDLDDVEADLAVGKLGDVGAQLLDVGALFADHDTRSRGMECYSCLLGGALDDDAGHARLPQTLMQKLA